MMMIASQLRWLPVWQRYAGYDTGRVLLAFRSPLVGSE
jgi:hypothetical protein